jgi:hypothetical protein
MEGGEQLLTSQEELHLLELPLQLVSYTDLFDFKPG